MPAVNRERAILVGLELKGRPVRRSSAPVVDGDDFDTSESLDELSVLAESAGAAVVERFTQAREAPDAATLIGSGKVEELRNRSAALEAEVVIFDRDLTPTQLRNLDQALPARVIDRTQLILDIFASRAQNP